MGRRPWLPSEKDLKNIEAWAARGLTVEQISDGLGISEATFYEKQNHIPELLEALKRGRSSGLVIVANKLFENATTKNNLTAQIFYLKCRGGWREQDSVRLETKDNRLIIDLGTNHDLPGKGKADSEDVS